MHGTNHSTVNASLKEKKSVLKVSAPVPSQESKPAAPN